MKDSGTTAEVDDERPAAMPPRTGHSVLDPFRRPAFRMLWVTWLMANTCMWMNDVAAAWVMTTLTTSPLLVALVQSSATLPMFLLGLPSGAFADSFDRRRYFIFTQFWVASVATVMCLAIVAGWLGPWTLLALTFANGIGLAMRWPVFSAIVPELVPRDELPAALALNGISMNASRIVGPLIAGALIAAVGSAAVFVLNAALSVIAGFIIMRWRREHVESPLGREPLFSAMRVGLQFVRQSTRLRAALVRIALFFFHSTALLALLPLTARHLHGGSAGTYTVLLASMGAGAIAAALFLPRVRQHISRDTLVMGGTLVQSAATLAVAFAPGVGVAAPAMFVAGMAWISTANSLSVSAQLALPDWVRARGMSIYQMAIMGSSAAGAAVWGQVASVAGLQESMTVAAVTGALAMLAAGYVIVDRGTEEDLTPSRAIPAPRAADPPAEGQIVLMVEYRIDPARATEFRALMQESRRRRLGQGALSWELLEDIHDPGRFVERIVDESWTEHLRRFDRITRADVALRERRLAFHTGTSPPLVTRYVIDPSSRA